jgi:formylglycine-generating enzyme required for sulfatase activity
MYDIFLSYSTQDRERLMPLVKALEQQGWSVFWDHRSVPIGKHWQQVIGKAVSESRCVVVAWSASSVHSEWVIEEAIEGKHRGVLLPIRLDDVKPPFGFQIVQAGNFIQWGGETNHADFTKLSAQIHTLVGEKTATPSAPPVISTPPVVARPSKPAWASAAGDDQYGRYADLNVKGIIQRFRQIKPGTFLMGSPPSEPGHRDNETQHKVTLTQGFWLADTACTQALWQTVMGNNPANFKDSPNNPVEVVSWNDAQGFIQKLNSLVTGVSLRLPTEAEWEYACRAGATSAFSFGGKDDLSLNVVNYSGKWDEYDLSGKTKPVKTYLPNRWGLHEMHGNVWEWCQDWYDSYPAEPVTNPEGSQTGVERVIRGGSWYDVGGLCRSACRSRNGPDNRISNLDFRLLLGH